MDVRTQPDSLFRYAEFCSSAEVNSVRLREVLERAIEQAPKPPDKVRFFRRQMNNMITKACQDVGVSAYPSRRTLAIDQWIRERMEQVYPTLPNYQATENPSVSLPTVPPQSLPDALLGEKWTFVTLEASAFDDMPDWDISFSEAFPPKMAGVNPDTPIPGLIIYSTRSLPLAAWMSGLELACVKFSLEPTPCLVLETGANESWILANITTPDLQTEVKNFEAAKQKANQVHFLAVQANPTAEAFAGFWLLRELNLV